MHCRTIGIGSTPQGVKLGDDPKPAIWGLRALLIQIGIELHSLKVLNVISLRALLIQIGIEPPYSIWLSTTKYFILLSPLTPAL